MGIMGREGAIMGRARCAATAGTPPERATTPSTTENQTFLMLHLFVGRRTATDAVRSGSWQRNRCAKKASGAGPAAVVAKKGSGDVVRLAGARPRCLNPPPAMNE